MIPQSDAEDRALRERGVILEQRTHVCAECGAGLIAVKIEGELRAICTRGRLSHDGKVTAWKAHSIKMASVETTQDALRRGTMTTREMVVYKSGGQEVQLSIADVRTLIAPKATEAEAFAFIKLCQGLRVNPFLGEAYVIKYDERQAAAFVVGKNAWLRHAEEDPAFAGMKAGVITIKRDGSESVITRREGTVIFPGEELFGGWCEVKRRDRQETHRVEVMLSEYNRNMALWKEKPATMIRKVALVQALRESFPGLWSDVRVTASERDMEGLEVSVDASFREAPDETTESVGTEAPLTIGKLGRSESTAKDNPSVPWPDSCPVHETAWKENRYGRYHAVSNAPICTPEKLLRERFELAADAAILPDRAEWMKNRFGNRPWSKLTVAEMYTAVTEVEAMKPVTQPSRIDGVDLETGEVKG